MLRTWAPYTKRKTYASDLRQCQLVRSVSVFRAGLALSLSFGLAFVDRKTIPRTCTEFHLEG